MTSRDPIRVGVVGVGRIGAMHASMVAGAVPGLALAAVHDADAAAAAAVAGELGVPAFATSAELIGHPDVDAVAICSSTNTHVDLLVQAASTGKPVFLEKPVSLDLAEVDRGLRAVTEAGAFLQLGFNRCPSLRARRRRVGSSR